MLKERNVYVPKDKELRAEIIQSHHNIPIAGHGGKWKTIELVTRDIGQYVKGYYICQRIKNKTEIPVGKLKLSGVSEKP